MPSAQVWAQKKGDWPKKRLRSSVKSSFAPAGSIKLIWPLDESNKMDAKKGKWKYTPNGWVATSLSNGQTVLGIRVSVTAGSAKDLSNLGVGVHDASGNSYTVAAALSSPDDTVVLWLFAVDRGSSASYGPYTLLFPSGETVDIGMVGYQQ